MTVEKFEEIIKVGDFCTVIKDPNRYTYTDTFCIEAKYLGMKNGKFEFESVSGSLRFQIHHTSIIEVFVSNFRNEKVCRFGS